MQGFLRPGQKQTSAFGVSFDADRGISEPVSVYVNPSLNLQEQRRRLPISKLRWATSLPVFARTIPSTAPLPDYRGLLQERDPVQRGASCDTGHCWGDRLGQDHPDPTISRRSWMGSRQLPQSTIPKQQPLSCHLPIPYYRCACIH